MDSNEAMRETALNLLAGISWDRELAEQFTAKLDGAALALLQAAILEEFGQRGDETIVESVREFIAAEYADFKETKPIAVVFETGEWNNGFYLDDRNATVFFDDGSHDEGVEITKVRDAMTDTYGKVGPKAQLGVDLRTGQIEYSENSDETDVCALLGIKNLETARRSEGPEDNRAPAKTNP